MPSFNRMSRGCGLVLLLLVTPALILAKETQQLFVAEHFTESDSILVIDNQGGEVYSWNAEKERIPASVVKLLTTWLAIEKWGLQHQFTTRFYVSEDTLWIRGAGDPMLISEELIQLAENLRPLLPDSIGRIGVDASLFGVENPPGRGASNDPYNAPLSALSVNFNTISLQTSNTGQLQSGEPQTPLTPLAKRVARNWGKPIGKRPERINLRTARNAQQQFAELLANHLGWSANIKVVFDRVPAEATSIYEHKNSHTLAATLKGTLEYSNNFIANQLFLLMAEHAPTDFNQARESARQRWQRLAGWQNAKIVEGAGLSRSNRLSARQIATLLASLQPHRMLLKRYSLRGVRAHAYAKSGTLDGVHTLAGYLEIDHESYRFVFLFNRSRPIGYREALLQTLADELSATR